MEVTSTTLIGQTRAKLGLARAAGGLDTMFKVANSGSKAGGERRAP
jgi:hypothetical protein